MSDSSFLTLVVERFTGSFFFTGSVFSGSTLIFLVEDRDLRSYFFFLLRDVLDGASASEDDRDDRTIVGFSFPASLELHQIERKI